jgi:hypothetical protein
MSGTTLRSLTFLEIFLVFSVRYWMGLMELKILQMPTSTLFTTSSMKSPLALLSIML